MCVYIYTHIHIHTKEYYSVIKKDEILPFVMTWMDLEGIMLSEISQRENVKFHMISLISRRKTRTNKHIALEIGLLIIIGEQERGRAKGVIRLTGEGMDYN